MAVIKYTNSNGETITVNQYKVNNVIVSNEKGTSETAVMSQKAVSDELNTLDNKIENIDIPEVDLTDYVTKEEVTHKIIDAKHNNWSAYLNQSKLGMKNGTGYTSPQLTMTNTVINGLLTAKVGDEIKFSNIQIYLVINAYWNGETYFRIILDGYTAKLPNYICIDVDSTNNKVQITTINQEIQSKLTAGDNITIDENNTISATVPDIDLSEYATKEELNEIASSQELNYISSDEIDNLCQKVATTFDNVDIPVKVNSSYEIWSMVTTVYNIYIDRETIGLSPDKDLYIISGDNNGLFYISTDKDETDTSKCMTLQFIDSYIASSEDEPIVYEISNGDCITQISAYINTNALYDATMRINGTMILE